MVGLLFVFGSFILILLWAIWFQTKELEMCYRIMDKQSRELFVLEEKIKELEGEA